MQSWMQVVTERHHNTKQFPLQLMRLTLFTIMKISQKKFPPLRLNSMLYVYIGDMYFMKTHYSSSLMVILWSSPCLSFLSKNDIAFKNLILKEAHIVGVPDNLGKNIH